MRPARIIIMAGAFLSALILVSVAAAGQGSLRLESNGTAVTILGATNLAAGDRILVTVVSAAFTPTEKGQAGEFAGASGTVVVQPGSPLNSFRFEVDVSGFPPGLYLVTAESLETEYRDSAQFVLPWPPAPATSPPATASTTTPPASPATPAPATTPPRPTEASPPMPLTALVSLPALAIAAWMALGRDRGGG